MQSDSSTSPSLVRIPPRQTVHMLRPEGAMTPLMVRRIREALARGIPERKIAADERVSERDVVRVRTAELDRKERQMNAVGVAVGTMLDTMRHLHRDIDREVVDELCKGEAA